MLLVLGTAAVVIGTTNSSNPPTTEPVGSTLGAATVASPLTGLPVTPEVGTRRPWAVVVSNLPASRPQTGLSAADVVFEAPAEAGITRFLALFQSQLPAKVMPIRSARPYFNDWAATLSALYSHSGGSTEALAELKNGYGTLQDVNEFSNGDAYQRDPAKKAPHNLFTTAEKFWGYVTAHNWATPTNVLGLTFGPQVAPGRKTTSLTIPYQPTDYQVHYDWSQTSQTWLRSVGGKPQMDAATNTPISVKNAVVMVTDIVPMPNDPQLKVTITTLGHGQVIVFRDGQRFDGQWSKPTLASPLAFTDAQGNALPLAPGNTWISVVDKATAATLEQTQ